LTKARASATRCCCPPESSLGRRSKSSPTWTRSAAALTRPSASSRGVFYLVPSLILYAAAQRYLMQMSIGGVKG
jgi:hypothetical protein